MADKGEAGMMQLFPAFEVGPFAEFNARNTATAMLASRAFFKAAGAYWGRMSAFAKKRLTADTEAALALSACRTGGEAVRTQHEFVSKMISDYFAEMHALLSIGAEAARGIAEPIENRAEEAVERMEARVAAE